MPEHQQETPLDLGRFPGPDARTGPSGTDLVGAVLCLVWIVAAAAYLLLSPGDEGPLGLVMTALVIFLPLALIWVAVSMSQSIRHLRDEAERLQAAVDAMRNAYVAQNQTSVGLKSALDKKLDDLMAAQKHGEVVLANLAARCDGSVAPPADRKVVLALPRPKMPDEQPTLALGTPAEDLRPPLTVSDFIRALNFPESPEDKAGFRALRLALEDHSVSKLIRAAQDVLTLLSQDGIYMDDLRPDRVRPDVWRRFAQGERGRTISGLGGVRDRSSLALTAARMREDTVFRDAVHHFLRTFDKTFQEFEKNATDQDITEMAETRTARAFMLFGRVSGSFE